MSTSAWKIKNDSNKKYITYSRYMVPVIHHSVIPRWTSVFHPDKFPMSFVCRPSRHVLATLLVLLMESPISARSFTRSFHWIMQLMNDAHRFEWRFFRQLISIVFPERCKTAFFLLRGFIRLAKILRAFCASYTCHNPCSRSLRECRDFAELMFVLFAFFFLLELDANWIDLFDPLNVESGKTQH